MKTRSLLPFVMWVAFCTGAIGCRTAAPVAEEAADTATPTVFLIGDSTVNNPVPGQMGWGNCIESWFDTNRVRVVNRARGGRSSRTFFTEGLWEQVRAEIRPGDFVLMQFGHNDGGGLNHPRQRASIKGVGDESQLVTNRVTGAVEEVRSYGWYLRRYVNDTRERGGVPVVMSPIPRNLWTNDVVRRASNDYGGWAREVARQEDVAFVDLNERVAQRYEALGRETVESRFFDPSDHTHTKPEGAALNAECVAAGLRELPGSPFARFLRRGNTD